MKVITTEQKVNTQVILTATEATLLRAFRKIHQMDAEIARMVLCTATNLASHKQKPQCSNLRLVVGGAA